MASDTGPVADPGRNDLVGRLIASTDQVARVSGRRPDLEFLQWISRGRLGRPAGWPQVPRLASPWQDTISGERPGWRQRAANDAEDLDGDFAFAVDYRICRRCAVGWVDNPYTREDLQRGGLAAAGLAALRGEHPGLSWHTLGGHFSDSQQFWAAAGAGVPGGYQQRKPCEHLGPS